MAQTVLLKRSSVAGNVPDSSDLSLGEIAVNTADGAVYIKKVTTILSQSQTMIFFISILPTVELVLEQLHPQVHFMLWVQMLLLILQTGQV